MDYLVQDNYRHRYISIHKSDCSHTRGHKPGGHTSNTHWRGAASLESARKDAASIMRIDFRYKEVRICGCIGKER